MILRRERFNNGEDIFLLLSSEDVVFRWDGSSRVLYKKFRDESESIAVNSDKLFAESRAAGEEISREDYDRF